MSGSLPMVFQRPANEICMVGLDSSSLQDSHDKENHIGRGTGPRGLEMAVACPGVDSQDLGTILDPFRTIFDDLGPDRLSAT